MNLLRVRSDRRSSHRGDGSNGSANSIHRSGENDSLTSCRDAHQNKINQLTSRALSLQKEIENIPANKIMNKNEEIKAVETLRREASDQLRIFNEAISKISSSTELTDKNERNNREIRRLEGSLPFYAFRNDVVNTVQSHNVSIIIGETGSGLVLLTFLVIVAIRFFFH